MILQALHDLAQRESLVDDPDFEPRPVAWIIRISETGEPLGIIGTHSLLPSGGKRKPKRVAKMFRIPRRPTGKSGIKAPPGFLVENAKYVFGLPTQDKAFSAEEGEEKSRWFRDLVTECAEATHDKGARAVVQLLNRVAADRHSLKLPEDCRSNDLFAFQFVGDEDLLVHDRPNVRAWWKDQRKSVPESESNKHTCLVTGASVGETGLFELIKKLPGGTPSGVALVSFNKGAFESYGWKGNDNAPISRDAAEACATALNRLLDPRYPNPRAPEQSLPQRSLRLSSNTAVCYWSARDTGDEFCSVFGGLLEGNPETVKNLYRSIWYGKAPEIEDASAFYALTLSGTQGRASVRDWFESTVARVARNLALHFGDLNIVRNTPKGKGFNPPAGFPITTLLESLAPRGDREQIPGHFVSQLVESALRGSPYPYVLLQRAVERTRAEIGRQNASGVDGYRTKVRSDARAALIKAVLNRRKQQMPEIMHYKEVSPDMDPNNSSEGYTLGRLMAVLERIQQEAIPSANATVVDRFFSGASAAPKTVFVRLLKNARHHVAKGKDDNTRAGFVFRLDRIIDELASRFDPSKNGFPAHLDLDQQGLFILGYHQMRKWLWMSKEERNQWEMNHPDAPGQYIWSKQNE